MPIPMQCFNQMPLPMQCFNQMPKGMEMGNALCHGECLPPHAMLQPNAPPNAMLQPNAKGNGNGECPVSTMPWGMPPPPHARVQPCRWEWQWGMPNFPSCLRAIKEPPSQSKVSSSTAFNKSTPHLYYYYLGMKFLLI